MRESEGLKRKFHFQVTSEANHFGILSISILTGGGEDSESLSPRHKQGCFIVASSECHYCQLRSVIFFSISELFLKKI